VHRLAPDLPVIVLAGTWDERLAMKAVQAGAQDYLLKSPIGLNSLGRAIRYAIERQTNRAALRASEQRFRALIENSADAIALLSADGTILYQSPSTAHVLGYPPSDVLGHNIQEFVRPSDSEMAAQMLAQVLRLPRQPVTAEVEFRRQDGSWQWVEATANNLLDEPGVQAIVVNYHDISDRKEAQRSLHRFELLSAHSRDIILFIRADDGRILEANAAAIESYGYSHAELLALSVNDLSAADEQGVVHDQAALAEVQGHRFETVHRRRDGATFPVEISSQAATIDGQLTVVNVMRDISERKQAEADLVLQGAALVAAANGIVITDRNGHIVWVNPAFTRLTGYAADEVLGQNPRILKSGQHDQAFYAVLWNTIGAGNVWHGEMVNRRKDGSLYFEEETITPVADARGAIHHFVAIKQDISSRKQAEAAELEQRTLAEALRDTAAALNSTLELDTLLGLILEYVGRVVPHDSANIMLVEETALSLAGSRGYSERGTHVPVLEHPLQFGAFPNIKFMAQTGQALVIPDTMIDPGWVNAPGSEWIRSYAGAPIRRNDQIIGFISLNSRTPGFFTAAHADRLKAFADQAGSALENARLLSETRQRLAELEAINRVSTALRTAETQDEMLPVLLNVTLAVMGAAWGGIWLYDPIQDEIRMAAAARGGDKVEMPPELPERPGEGINGVVFATGQPYLVSDLQQDPHLSPAARERIPPGVSAATIPIHAGEKIIGTLNIAVAPPRAITTGDVHLLTTLSAIGGNAIQRMRLAEQTAQRLQQLGALRAIDVAITSSLSLPVTLNVVLEQVMSQLQIDAADVLRLNLEANTLDHAGSRGFRSQPTGHPSLPLGSGYASQAVLERRLISRPNLSAETPGPGEPTLPPAEAFQAYYGVPLIAKGLVVGVLEVYQRTPLQRGPGWLELLEALAGQAAIAIDNARLFENMERSHYELSQAYDATIEGWTRALDLRDHETEGHSQRVTALTLELAVAMGMQAQQLQHVRRGALLHDIGKMGVPDSILLKPGPLTEDEWGMMRQHPIFAYNMLAPIAYLAPALDIPYCHHEKWDGTGYPRGLKGLEIPLAARIFAVVDVWDALRSDRPYRPAWPADRVLQHIRALEGTHFDPQIVTIALQSGILGHSAIG